MLGVPVPLDYEVTTVINHSRISLYNILTLIVYTLSPTKTHTIKAEDLQPCDCVSSDQFECRVKGRLAHNKGKEDTDHMYCGDTIFVDYTSDHINVYHQVSLGGIYTVRSKYLHELQTEEFGVGFKNYRGDN